MSPYSSKLMKQILDESLDKSYYRCIEGGAEVAIEITSSKFDLIIFTGSPQKGRLVS
jgi:aldehyde dehydrogenase (NAD+)